MQPHEIVKPFKVKSASYYSFFFFKSAITQNQAIKCYFSNLPFSRLARGHYSVATIWNLFKSLVMHFTFFFLINKFKCSSVFTSKPRTHCLQNEEKVCQPWCSVSQREGDKWTDNIVNVSNWCTSQDVHDRFKKSLCFQHQLNHTSHCCLFYVIGLVVFQDLTVQPSVVSSSLPLTPLRLRLWGQQNGNALTSLHLMMHVFA